MIILSEIDLDDVQILGHWFSGLSSLNILKFENLDLLLSMPTLVHSYI